MNPEERNSDDIFAEGYVEAIKRRRLALEKFFNIRKTEVKELRKGLGLSQYDFAEVYGIPLPTLQSWEQGRRTPDTFANMLLGLIKDDPQSMAERIAKLKSDNEA